MTDNIVPLRKNNVADLIDELARDKDKISDIAVVYQMKDEAVNVYWATSPLILCLFAAYLDVSAKREIVN
ncbi:MAG: hypothetical protein INF12_14550 [Methylobacterium sp.]|nr:hypothetical protein [Methylobacterium sp.]